MIIPLKDGNMLRLRMSVIDEEVDIDRFLTIDVSNLAAEIITAPAVLNKFGLLLADANETLSEKKLTLEILEAKVKEEIRNGNNQKEEEDDEEDPKGKKKLIPVKKLTVDEVNSMLIQNKAYQIATRNFIKAQKEVEYISSVYWSLKDKSGKLDKMSMSLTTGDVLEQLVNSKLKRMNFVDISVITSKIK